MKRRDWLLLSLMTGCSTLLPDEKSMAALLVSGTEQEEQPPVDQSTLNFWRQHVRGSARGEGSAWQSDRAPEFLMFDAGKGFIPATDLDSSILPDKGDGNVSVEVTGIRPSGDDQKMFEKSGHGSLRIDVQQTKASPGLPETLAFSALAALKPSPQGTLPALNQMKMNVGAAWGKWQKVPLPGGAGTWTWNFFLQKKDSLLARAAALFSAAAPMVPILGLPAIAKTALTAFDNYFGHVQASAPSHWLFQSAEVPVATTKEAKDTLTSPVLLHSGQYVVVPRASLSAFGKAMGGLEMNRGMVVPKGTSTTDVYDKAPTVLPDITYLGLDVKVTHTVPE